jgi:uncharacterized protein
VARRAGEMPEDFDLTPAIPSGRQLIQSYGPEGFTIAGVRYPGSVLILPAGTRGWEVGSFDQVTRDSLEPVVTAEDRVEILVLGSGARFAMVTPGFRQQLRAHGITVECMATGAACRTFNVLLAEDRRVAAALILPTP